MPNVYLDEESLYALCQAKSDKLLGFLNFKRKGQLALTIPNRQNC